jgi:beta-carotene 15,15'-dioxygenase
MSATARRERWLTRRAPYAALALAALAALALPRAVETLLWVPLLGGLATVGMAHGAVDHLVPGRVRRRPLTRGQLVAFMAGYVALALVGVAAWLAAPAAGLVAFLVVAAAHWGQGELWLTRDGALGAAARGLLPIAGPLVAHPGAVQAAASAILAPFGGGFALGRPVVAVLAAALAVVVIAAALRHPTSAPELLGLAAFFAVVPPVFAVGIYFVFWHSLRHVARLERLAPRRFARDAAPTTLAALAGIGVLGAIVAVDPGSAAQVAGVALAVTFGLTLPHGLVVAWMDRPRALSADGPRVLRADRPRLSSTNGPLPRPPRPGRRPRQAPRASAMARRSEATSRSR